MVHDEPARATAVRERTLGLTAYGCEPDEAELFAELAPRHGIEVTTTADPVRDAGAALSLGNRHVSVGHRSLVSSRELLALRDAGVDHLSTRSIGLDHIDLAAAAELGITVENVTYSPDGVADFTLMLILMAVRAAPDVMRTAGRSAQRGARGGDLRDMTVGVVGVGNIGAAVIRRLHGFGCEVLACSNGPTPPATVELVPLDELLRRSDVVTLHVPLTPHTYHLVGQARIDSMRPGAFLVNTGRGALVDTEALVVALERGRLGGAALDVVEGEERLVRPDPPIDHADGGALARLLALPNAIVTPHVAYRTRRALEETVEGTLGGCTDFERYREPWTS